MNFIGLIGDMGSGKTNFLTAILYLSEKSGKKIAANYSLEIPYYLMPFSELATLPEVARERVIGMDELGVGADSYDFFDKDVRKLGKLVTQLRKRDCIVYYTVQRFSMIASRLRKMTDRFILFRDLDAHNDHTVKGYVCEGLFELRFFDADFIEYKEPQVFDGKPYRHLYDTKEIIW